jgi:hypothetical protein
MGTGPKRIGVAVAIVTLAVLGACSRTDGDSAMDARLPAADESGAAKAVAAGSNDVVAPVPADLGHDRVVRTASLEVEVAKGTFAGAFSKVPTIAAANGGFVASSSSQQGGDEARQAAGSLVVRVPAEHFDATRRQLVALGELRSEQLQGEDVGGRMTDLDARLRNLRSHEDAIRLLMTKAGTIGETIEVQRQLSTVREQIEQLAAEQARLADAVALSTLTLSLAEPGVAFVPDDGASPLGDALGRAVDGAERVVAAVIVTLGYLVPVGFLGVLVWLAARPFTGRRRDPAPTPAAP